MSSSVHHSRLVLYRCIAQPKRGDKIVEVKLMTPAFVEVAHDRLPTACLKDRTSKPRLKVTHPFLRLSRSRIPTESVRETFCVWQG